MACQVVNIKHVACVKLDALTIKGRYKMGGCEREEEHKVRVILTGSPYFLKD